MSKVNDTTRCFPRTLEDAFKDNVEAIKQREQWEWMEHYVPDHHNTANLVMVFFAGFIVSMLIFI